MNNVIVKNLFFSYEQENVLTDINLSFSKSDFLAILGPNGGGKSTLLKLMLGILSPKKGSISILGKTPKEAKKHIGYVPQDVSINKNFPITALEVALMGRLGGSFGYFGKEDLEITKNALETVGVIDFANKKIGSLSGGQRQRVFIARALAANVDFLFLDEPTANIDPKGQIEIYELLKRLNKNTGIAIVSHDVNILIGYANIVANINNTIHLHKNIKVQREDFIKNISSDHICPVELLVQNKISSNHIFGANGANGKWREKLV